MELHDWIYRYFVEEASQPLIAPSLVGQTPQRATQPPAPTPASAVPRPAEGQPQISPPGPPVGQSSPPQIMAPPVELDYDVGRALWWLFQSHYLIVEKKDLLGGNVHNSAEIAKALARKEGKPFMDLDQTVKALVDQGKYPLVAGEYGPEGTIIVNPSSNPMERSLNPLVLAGGRGWIVQLVQLRSVQRTNEAGQVIVDQEIEPKGDPFHVDKPLGLTRGDDLVYAIISGPPGFLLPDPLEPGKTVENPARTAAEFAAYQDQRNQALNEASKIIASSGAYHTNTFLDRPPPPRAIVDKTWIRLQAIVGATGAIYGSHLQRSYL